MAGHRERGEAAITVYVGTFPDRLLRCYPYRGDAVIAMISDESLVVIDRLMASDLFLVNHFLIGRVLLFVYIYIWNIFFFGEETFERSGDSSEEEKKKVKKK